MKLNNRRILLTGASSGIGVEIARLFEAEGARLALVARNHQELEATRQSLASPDRHVALAGDMTAPEAVSQVVDSAADTFSGLDGIVHSAGCDLARPFMDTSLAEWRSVLDGNLTSAFIVCQAAVPHLRDAAGATIVTLGSGLGLLPLPARSAYCASKAGLVMFSKALALELASDDIRVNALCPGAIDTPMLRRSVGGSVGEPMPEAVVSRFAMGRVGQADEIAKAALFLSCEDSSFVTGTALVADGGRAFH